MNDSPPIVPSFTLVAFTGKAGSGKSTACQYLSDYNYFVEMNFADPLKRGVARMFNWSEASMYDSSVKDHKDSYLGFSRREALQAIGTEGVRECLGADIFIKLLERRIEHYRLVHGVKDLGICIGDLRFENEARKIRELGGVVVHLTRKGTRELDNKYEHISEKGITLDPEEDLVIFNDGTIDYFHHRLKDILEEIRERKEAKQNFR